MYFIPGNRTIHTMCEKKYCTHILWFTYIQFSLNIVASLVSRGYVWYVFCCCSCLMLVTEIKNFPRVLVVPKQISNGIWFISSRAYSAIRDQFNILFGRWLNFAPDIFWRATLFSMYRVWFISPLPSLSLSRILHFLARSLYLWRISHTKLPIPHSPLHFLSFHQFFTLPSANFLSILINTASLNKFARYWCCCCTRSASFSL